MCRVSRTSLTIGSSKIIRGSEFFRGADFWEFMALVFTEFSELAERVGICDVLAVPSEEIIYFPNDCHCNVQGIANFIFGNITAIKIKTGEF